MRTARSAGYCQAKAKLLRLARRTQVLIRNTPESEMGCRPSTGSFLALKSDERFEGDPVRIMKHMAWLWFKRDPETGELPFGVW